MKGGERHRKATNERGPGCRPVIHRTGSGPIGLLVMESTRLDSPRRNSGYTAWKARPDSAKRNFENRGSGIAVLARAV